MDLLKRALAWAKDEQNRPLVYVFGGSLSVLIFLWKTSKSASAPRRKITWAEENNPDIWDVAIIGAGPSGATTGFYLAQEKIDGRPVRCVMLEKKEFPRDKFCGDAVTTLAQKHLKRMGVIKELVDEDEGYWSRSGGFVSPSGFSFIGNSAEELGRDEEGVVIAVKRKVMDEKIARAAARAGAVLKENTTVMDAKFDASTGIWTVTCQDNEGNALPPYRARALVTADGAGANFARKFGLIKTEPDGVCSRSYVTGEFNFEWDGVIYYPRALLPGYCALLRHTKNTLGYCVYIIPGNPDCPNDCLPQMHDNILHNDPYVSAAIGPKANPGAVYERMKAAGLRLGGLKAGEKSYADHLLVIGDAAGFIDPLTGEGIQYAMESGEMAANTLIASLRKRDLGSHMMKKYQDMWYSDWGREFYWSMKISLALYRFPIFLDAAAKLIEKRGAKMLADWAEVMTGSQSKVWFLRPDVWSLIVLEALGIGFRKLFMPHTLPKGPK